MRAAPAVLPALCLPLSATVVPGFSLEQLTKAADMIVQARIERAWAAWDSGHKFIWTHYQLTPIDFLKGSTRWNVVVSETGGSLDGRSMEIQGTPRFRAGEELILFLYRTPSGYLRTVGYGQGRYDMAGGRIKVDRSGIELARSPQPASGTDLRTLDDITVAEFKRRVRLLIAQQRSPQAR